MTHDSKLRPLTVVSEPGSTSVQWSAELASDTTEQLNISFKPNNQIREAQINFLAQSTTVSGGDARTDYKEAFDGHWYFIKSFELPLIQVLPGQESRLVSYRITLPYWYKYGRGNQNEWPQIEIKKNWHLFRWDLSQLAKLRYFDYVGERGEAFIQLNRKVFPSSFTYFNPLPTPYEMSHSSKHEANTLPCSRRVKSKLVLQPNGEVHGKSEIDNRDCPHGWQLDLKVHCYDLWKKPIRRAYKATWGVDGFSRRTVDWSFFVSSLDKLGKIDIVHH